MTESESLKNATMSPGSLDSSSPLDLLLDVQLEATIRFGEKQLLLRDILAARPGTVFELDRDLNQSADLLVAGRLIARGEVVVVDGNFGLRVTELANQGQSNHLDNQLIPS